jgi:predicted nucleic acid-binding protein
VTRYVLDTNLYVQAFRNSAAATALEQFYLALTPHSYLSSVVLHELLVGANTPAKARQIERDIARPFQQTGRLITPTHQTWVDGAGALARLARQEGLELRRVPKSLVHDVLLAVSCREAGATLVTDNAADFARLQRYVRFTVAAPWPT